MQLIPKIRTPVTAIRVTEDLAIKSGDWLIIFDHDVIGQMTDAEVRANFLFPEDLPIVVPREPPRRRSSVRAPSGPLMQRARAVSAAASGARVVRTATHSFKLNGHNFGAQMVRILDALYQAAHRQRVPRATADLRPFTHQHDLSRIASRLGDAAKLGLVEAAYDQETKTYTLTERGVEVVNLFGEEARTYVERHRSGVVA